MTTHTDAPADDLVERLERLARSATRGLWIVSRSRNQTVNVRCVEQPHAPSVANIPARLNRTEDADFIADACPDNILALTARIRSLEAQRDEAVGLLRRSNEALANVTAFEWDAREIMGNTNFEICKHAREQVRAFLDSLTEKR